MQTDFVHWYPLSDADRHAPEEPGVFQVRVVDGLLDYPSGKSAMVHYESSTNLRQSIALTRQQHPEGDFLCRHQSSANPAVLLQFVRSQFTRRFGCEPHWPAPQM